MKHALSRLAQVVGTLEGSVEILETSLSGAQRDMFSMPPVANKDDKMPPLDTTILTQKLDAAIDTIESLLDEDQDSAEGGAASHG